ncbi:hypothetical protein [Desulfosporosinus sp. Sb-LF]|uniref:hypothetical protein n=1 Tax=Desulfosporosinus sp. Sb-LF TaxID=2560027 RepID=UPI001100FFDB|nr:hypothetical protein [Desulfosporosinus sp. Sb-LF]TGE32184.1 hypothetical protein E4K68_13790 [Desulfosporosinus sp. Sb-LF]
MGGAFYVQVIIGVLHISTANVFGMVILIVKKDSPHDRNYLELVRKYFEVKLFKLMKMKKGALDMRSFLDTNCLSNCMD